MVEGVISVITFLLSAATHELGHYLTARILSVPCRFIRASAIGLVMQFDFSRTSYLDEAAVHLGGAVFAELSAILSVLIIGDGAHLYLGITTALSVINLLPIRGMDGAAAAEALLNIFMLPCTATKITRTVSFITWSTLWCAVIWIEMRVRANLSLILFVIGLMLQGKG